MACCGYAGLLIIGVMPILIATAVGGVVRYFTGSRRAGAWTAAGLAVAMNSGMAGAVYYYSTHLAGGRVEPELYLRQLIGFAVMGSVIGGVTSFFLCRAMR